MIGCVSFENDYLEELCKGRVIYVFGGNSLYYEKELVKKYILLMIYVIFFVVLFWIW